ncbi:MAG TPA: hypothetical protein VJR03_00690 [Nitrospira sp.]|nr:hypothetical protein [Nitrospira sp.]
MNARTACRCIIVLSLVSIGLPTQSPATAASGSNTPATAHGETRKPPATANPNEIARERIPAGKTREAPRPADRAREVEERVRSGQMDQPIAQGEISERLNQLQSGVQSLSDEPARGHLNR